MKKRMILLALATLLVTPMNSYAETELKTGLDSSTPCTEFGTANAKIIFASVMDDKDQPCYVGREVTAYCSRNNPYFNVFDSNCYPNLQECKKADGDLSTVEGSGGCVRCSK